MVHFRFRKSVRGNNPAIFFLYYVHAHLTANLHASLQCEGRL